MNAARAAAVQPKRNAPRSAGADGRGSSAPRAALRSAKNPPPRLAPLLIGTAIGGVAIWLLRQTWAKSQLWPWILLLFAMFLVAWILTAAEPWIRAVPQRVEAVLDAISERELGGWVCIGASLVLTFVLVLSLAPDFRQWQGTPMIWLLAIALLLLGSWLLQGVGKAAPRAATASSPWSESSLQRSLEISAFVLILALALFLRLYRLGEIPSGIYVDETNAGLDALYILEGRDASPFATGWYGTPNGYIYYMALIFKLFGANWFALKWISLIPAILTVPAVYLLGRSVFGPLQGLVAMLLMAVSRWHLSMSRWGWNETAPPLFQVLAMYFLLRGLRGRRALDYSLSGLLMGFSLYTYVGARLAVITWAVFILYWFVSDPDGMGRSIRRSWRGVLIMAAAALVAAAPVLVTYVSDPFSYGNRVAEISVLRDIRSQGTLQPLLLNLTDILKFFHQTGDLQGKHNLPGEPMMDPVTGWFFAVGVAYALLRLRDHRRVMLLLWLAIGLAGSYLSSHHESPQAYRALAALPAGILLAADALATTTLALRGVRALPARPRHPRRAPAWLSAGFLLLALAGAAAWESYVYFRIQARSTAVIRGFNPTENGVARETIAGLDDGKSVFLSPGFAQFSPLRFLVYGAYKLRDGRNTLDDRPYAAILPATGLPLPADSGNVLMLLESQYWPLREHILSFYPQAAIELAQLSDGSPLYVRVSVAAQDVSALTGLTLRTTFADGRVTRERASSIEPPSGPSPTAAEWEGAIRLDRSARYEFESGSAWQVFLDDRPFVGEGFLGQGLYRIHVLWSPQTPDAAPLRWRIDGGDWEPVPSPLLFNVSARPQGLEVTYWDNTSWEGERLFTQIAPFVMLSWTEDMLPGTAFSARFSGTLEIVEAGTYEFQVEADDGARLLLDSRLIGEGLVPNQPNRFNASIGLEPGLHSLQLDYVQFGGGSGLRLMWRHGEGQFEPVPPSALIPTQP